MTTGPATPAPTMPADMVMEVLGTAAGDVLLIGGQALAVWARHFGVVRTDRYDITRDVDFLVTDPDDRAMVRRFAQALGGQSVFPHPRNAMTALVGSAYKEVGDSTYNVDVLFRVFGMVREDVERNSVTMETAGVRTKVMHPIDVLESRCINLHKLAEKQNDAGVRQLDLAIRVVDAYLRQQAARMTTPGDPEEMCTRKLMNLFSPVVDLANESAARKNAERHGVHVADAIPVDLIPPGPFWDNQWDRLSQLMSPERVDACLRGFRKRFDIPTP
ncbi:MAG: hypothetical protein KBG99_08400 [Pseudoxanthomonas sp.]|nr:hypothetical protein [Pseudoxanthomonas sp.]MBP8804381.1 hypothetical protein [Pseudoxanthomonas sp.]